MNLKALHYATLGIDIAFFVRFVLCFLANCFADALSGMDHSSNHAANARRRRILHISYSITILLNIVGFFLLFSLTGYYYYQIIAKGIICLTFLICFIIQGCIKYCCAKTMQIVEGVYVITLILHIIEFVYWRKEKDDD